MVETKQDISQEGMDELATQECDCMMARDARRKEKQKMCCIKNIEEILGERYPDIAEIFKGCIDAVQKRTVKKITIQTNGNENAKIYDTKDGIKVELEVKKKVENLA